LNIKEFISSGIIESYVLGLASAEEVAEVRRLAAQQKEVAEAVEYVEVKFEMLGLQNAIPPPTDAWGKIKQNMDDLRIQERKHDEVSRERTQTRANPFTVINIQNQGNQISVHKYWRPVFIAVFILSKIFLILSLYYYFKSDSLIKENIALKQQVEVLKK
jgi:anti-sigma-K factor RskA